MANNNLPRVGVIAEVVGFDKYISNMGAVEKATAGAARAIEASTKKSGASIDGVSKLLDKFGGNFGKQINGVIEQFQGFQTQIPAVSSSLGGMNVALVATAAAAVAAGAAFLALGQRGAALTGLGESFDRLNATIGINAVASLERLRAAAGGTIADFELIRQSNIALAGATGETGRAIGESLPRLLEIARVQSRSTGASVDYLFQSLVTGIRRSSPMLIDNTGLTIKIGEANAVYAASIGKTVEALSAEDRQLALLNATIAAGDIALAAAAGMQETVAEKIARANATITNTLDALAIGVQPAFGMFVDVGNRVLTMFSSIIIAANPLISSFLEMGAALVTGPLNAILSLLDPVFKLTSFFLTLATVILQPVMRAIGALGNAFGTGVTRIVQFLGDWVNQNLGLNFDNLALNFGRGAGFIFGAFAEGIMQAANAVVLPAVLWVATAIADFLVGQSPPPKGPLSQIDKGGAATMTAWMEGMASVSLQPVNQVAAAVEATLGNVGRMALPQVEARLGVLDQALAPFNNQLEIIKANFEAISTPAKAALDAIERQTASAQEALAAGDIGAAERVRKLDEQREMIEKAVAAQQQLVDSAQIQQALAKSQQAPERALLAIQQARLKALETKPTKETKAAAEAAGKGGAATTPESVAAGGGGAIGGGMGLPSVSDLISGQSAVDQMGADLGQGFTEGLAVSMNAGTVSTFNGLVSQIGAQTARIGQANIGERISNAFAGLGTSIQTKLQEASDTITNWIGSITDPAREGSIPYSFNALANGDYTALTASLTAPFENLADAVAIDVQNLLSYFNDPSNQEGITAGLQAFTDNLPTWLQPISQMFTDNWTTILADIQTWTTSAFSPDDINSIPGQLALLPTRIENALRSLPDSFNTAVLVPIQDTITGVGLAVANFFTGTGEGTLSGYIDAGVAWFVALPQRIFDALADMGRVFFAVIVTPLIGGLNIAIEGIEGLINNALSGLGTLIGSLQAVADAVGLGDQISEISSNLAGGINLPRLAMPTAPAATPIGARVGGFFSEGNLRVHRGEQLVQNATKTAVFPAGVTRDLDIIARVIGGGGGYDLPLLAGAGDRNSHNSPTYNNTFNMQQPPSTGNAAQQIATMMAMKNRR